MTPAVADILKLLHAQEPQCSDTKPTEPRVGRESPPPSEEDGQLQILLDELTHKQSMIVEFLWKKPSSVAWESLPEDAFRAGGERTDEAVKRVLTRLRKRLDDLYGGKHWFRLEIDWPRRRVRLIHDDATRTASDATGDN